MCHNRIRLYVAFPILASLMLPKGTSLVQGLLAIAMLVLFQLIITGISVGSDIFKGWIKGVILETDGSFSLIKKLGDSSASALIDVKGYPK